jgi:hypothetical protein
VSFQCFGERPDGGQTDDVTCGHAPEEQQERVLVLGVLATTPVPKSRLGEKIGARLI